MSNTLVSNAQLGDFPSAPYPSSVLDAVAADVRREAGWHIAPAQEETVTLDGPESQRLILPTLRLVAVTEIRDVSGDDPVILDGYRVNTRTGIVYRRAGWPCGVAVIEVDMEHGFVSVPPDLLPEIAVRCQDAVAVSTGSKSSFTIDDYTETTEESSSAATARGTAVRRYRVGGGFA